MLDMCARAKVTSHRSFFYRSQEMMKASWKTRFFGSSLLWRMLVLLIGACSCFVPTITSWIPGRWTTQQPSGCWTTIRASDYNHPGVGQQASCQQSSGRWTTTSCWTPSGLDHDRVGPRRDLSWAEQFWRTTTTTITARERPSLGAGQQQQREKETTNLVAQHYNNKNNNKLSFGPMLVDAKRKKKKKKLTTTTTTTTPPVDTSPWHMSEFSFEVCCISPIASLLYSYPVVFLRYNTYSNTTNNTYSNTTNQTKQNK